MEEIAGDKDATVMGANVQQQFIAAGLMDEIRIRVVPILLSEGVRLSQHTIVAHKAVIGLPDTHWYVNDKIRYHTSSPVLCRTELLPKRNDAKNTAPSM